MSSQGGSDLGKNAVLCYFTSLPYCVRYQIAFDILINPSDRHADTSVAGESQRLLRVDLFFPDGFIISNIAPSCGIAHPPALDSVAPLFCPVQSRLIPQLFPHGERSDLHHPMHFEGLIMSEDHRQARMFVNVVNGQPGQFIAIDDTPYDIIPQCRRCRGFHKVQERIHHQPSTSQQAEEQPGHSRQHPSTSGITDQSGASHAAPRKASEHVATDRNQRDTSHASPRTASERVATDRKYLLRKEITSCSIKTIKGDLKKVTAEGLYGTQGEKCYVTVFGRERTDNLIRHALDVLDMLLQIIDDNVPKDKKKTSADPNVDNDN